VSGNEWPGGYGISVFYPKTKVLLYFGHLQNQSEMLTGDKVDSDTVIGYVGNTGHVVPSSFYHIHLQVDVNGVRIKPSKLFDFNK
jgi:murein DD-endopeptidase MepM/ murein hydrolase activator NlpD